jgi:hypothetical protein
MSLPLEYMPYIIGGAFAIALFVLYYELKIKQTVRSPLPNEEDLGVGKFHLPQMGIFNEGRITTARPTVAKWFGSQITNAPSEKQAGLIALRKEIMDNFFFLAQRVGTHKIMYMSDVNPMDPRYCLREDKGDATPIRQIGPVQACFSLGTNFGFEWIGLKLTAARVDYTPDELEHHKTLVEAMMYSRDAASNLQKMKFLEDRVKTLEGRDVELNQKLSKITSEKDEIETGASAHSLLDREPLKTGHTFGPFAKNWFGDWKQIAALVAGYFVISPIIISIAKVPPTATNWVTALIVVLCYFAIPLFRKIFGRWLK